MQILLIAGHGAGDSGALGSGFQEQERTRALAQQLKGRIPGGETTLFDPSKNAVRECREGRVPDFHPYRYVLELHLNASSDPAANGTMCYIDRTETGHTVEDQILEQLYRMGYQKAWDGVVVTQRQFPEGLVVQNACRKQGVSHCLLEVCFITNEKDMHRFNSMLAQTAQAIGNGISTGFGLTRQKLSNTAYSGKGIATAIAETSMNVREGAALTSEGMGILYTGQAVEVLEFLSNGWIKVVWPGSPLGYAYTSNVKERYYRIEGKG